VVAIGGISQFDPVLLIVGLIRSNVMILCRSLIMRRCLTLVILLLIGLSGLSSSASAQWLFPPGYGGYGLSEWGANPAAGYMAGLGAYARGEGVYELDKAKADAINVDTMVKWNKALRARQAALREDQRQAAIAREAQRKERVEQLDLRDGTTLNNLLLEILDADPGVVKSARAQTPLSPAAIREIPFEWDSEAITLCIDQMTGKESLPTPLMASRYERDRNALQAVVKPALEEDAKGNISIETRKRIADAVASFRAHFVKETSEFEPGYQDALEYFTTMASLTRLLNDPSMKAFLARLDENKERTVGELIVFMHAYNLRFGAATSDRQLEIYSRLVPAFTEVRNVAMAERVPASAPDRTGQGLIPAAKQAFKGMSWNQLEAHLRGQ
jgi:hypothetical protein